ncbi:MAG: FmdB family zinc ribbon protein [Terriglobia bacterium]
MPLYEYQCKKCSAHFEKIRKFSDPPLTKCENCGGKLEQLVSSPAFQFKGTGWYVTDYARKPEASKPVSEASKEKPANGSDTKKGSETSKTSETSKPSATPAATK